MQPAALIYVLGIAINVAVVLLILRFWWARRDRLLAKFALAFFALAAIGSVRVFAQEYKQTPALLYTYAMGFGAWQLIFYLSHRAFSRFAGRKAVREAGSIKPVLTKAKLTIELPTGERYEIKDIPGEEIQQIIERLTKGQLRTSPSLAQQKGSILIELFFLGVPAVVALVLVSVLAYFIIKHPEKPVPEVLTTGITTVVGYYFGVGASHALAKPQPISRDELYQLISGERNP